jgi:hypothetical protein
MLQFTLFSPKIMIIKRKKKRRKRRKRKKRRKKRKKSGEGRMRYDVPVSNTIGSPVVSDPPTSIFDPSI